jgi:hypothetical protein
MSGRWLLAGLVALLLAPGCGEDPGTRPELDGIPEAIRDLRIAATTETTVTVAWTAPGNPAAADSARSYDLRISAEPLTDEGWDAATPVPDVPVPSAAGLPETATLAGVSVEDTIYLAIRYTDSHSRVSGRSNVIRYPPYEDTIPPASIRSLAVTSFTDSTVTLSWLAPGDDYRVGTARYYDIRFSREPITEESFDRAQAVPAVPIPSPAGERETFTAGGIRERAPYDFAIRTADSDSNWSGISNVVRAPFFWNPLGGGMDGDVRAVALFQGEPVAAGDFTMAGGSEARSIARWDGSAWQPLGGGLNGPAAALLAFEGGLIAGGSFTEAGGIAAPGVAVWDGSEWHAMGAGLPVPVSSLALVGGEPVAGLLGAGTAARWRDGGWTVLNPGQQGQTYAVAEYAGRIVAAGLFDQVPLVAEFDGSRWSGLGRQIGLPVVHALHVWQDLLYAGGACAEGQDCFTLGRWDGESWENASELPADVRVFIEAQGALFAGGSAVVGAGEPIGRWEGTYFHGFGAALDGTILSMTAYGPGILAGGEFNRTGTVELDHVAVLEL